MKSRIAILSAALAVSATIGGVAWAQGTSSVLDGVYTEAQAARGNAQYSQHCAACHGSGLTGNGEAPALVGGEFISNWAGLTLGDLFERIRTTMPQDNPGKLSRGQYAEILSFILRSNGYPAGQKEMDSRTEFLKAVAFVPPVPGGHAQAAPSPAAPAAQTAQAAAPAAGGQARAPRPPMFPPADLKALDAANQASGVLSTTANDPRNAPNIQPNSYVS